MTETCFVQQQWKLTMLAIRRLQCCFGHKLADMVDLSGDSSAAW